MNHPLKCCKDCWEAHALPTNEGVEPECLCPCHTPQATSTETFQAHVAFVNEATDAIHESAMILRNRSAPPETWRNELPEYVWWNELTPMLKLSLTAFIALEKERSYAEGVLSERNRVMEEIEEKQKVLMTTYKNGDVFSLGEIRGLCAAIAIIRNRKQ